MKKKVDCICKHAADDSACPQHGGWPKSDECNGARHQECDRQYCECICHKRRA